MYPLETFRDTLLKFVRLAEDLGIRYHLTGGITGTAYGEPRYTQDLDIVIDPVFARNNVDAFIRGVVNSDFGFDEGSLRSAMADGSMFQLMDEVEILKVDVYPREMIPGELDRSAEVIVLGDLLLPIVSRVDAIASKLVWINKGSHKSRRDVKAMHRSASETERLQLRELVSSMNLGRLLDEVLAEPDEFG